MLIRVNCLGCGKRLKVPDTAVGKRVKCPKCGMGLEVPATEPDLPDDVAPMDLFEVDGMDLPLPLERPRSRWPWIVAAFVVLLAVGGAVWYFAISEKQEAGTGRSGGGASLKTQDEVVKLAVENFGAAPEKIRELFGAPDREETVAGRELWWKYRTLDTGRKGYDTVDLIFINGRLTKVNCKLGDDPGNKAVPWDEPKAVNELDKAGPLEMPSKK